MIMDIPEINKFNIRVYGLVLNDSKQVLLSDEYEFDRTMTKFPGGGLAFGEGPEDCLKREALEEFKQEIEITGHFYTTHFFQRALFYPDSQLISIYYTMRFKDPIRFRISKVPFDFPESKNGSQCFRWAYVAKLSKTDLSFPIDQYVLDLLKRNL
jgi:8-oxo-dGTP diphosphatase